MEKEEQIQTKVKNEILHPAFSQCFPVFLVPFAMFLFLPMGVRFFYVLLFFWLMETSFLLTVWVYLATTFYIVSPDRIEIRRGVIVKRAKSIPFDKITGISLKQTLIQRLFGIGDLFIDTAGDKDLEAVMAGVDYPERVVQCLFALKKEAETCPD
jgi:uncharacterized membrane protein YdbT with pleckstrin-like domain